MRRKNTTTGSKFTVRGQIYIQTGAFFHPMGNGREVRVLELDTTCPECSQTFQVTASMRQISTRQLVRRCPECRKIHTGPVPIAKPGAHSAGKSPPWPDGWKAIAAPPSRLSCREAESAGENVNLCPCVAGYPAQAVKR
jgi:hypothetical protein